MHVLVGGAAPKRQRTDAPAHLTVLPLAHAQPRSSSHQTVYGEAVVQLVPTGSGRLTGQQDHLLRDGNFSTALLALQPEVGASTRHSTGNMYNSLSSEQYDSLPSKQPQAHNPGEVGVGTHRSVGPLAGQWCCMGMSPSDSVASSSSRVDSCPGSCSEAEAAFHDSSLHEQFVLPTRCELQVRQHYNSSSRCECPLQSQQARAPISLAPCAAADSVHAGTAEARVRQVEWQALLLTARARLQARANCHELPPHPNCSSSMHSSAFLQQLQHRGPQVWQAHAGLASQQQQQQQQQQHAPIAAQPHTWQQQQQQHAPLAAHPHAWQQLQQRKRAREWEAPQQQLLLSSWQHQHQQPLQSVILFEPRIWLAKAACHLGFQSPSSLQLALHCWGRLQAHGLPKLLLAARFGHRAAAAADAGSGAPSWALCSLLAATLWACAKLEERRRGLPNASAIATALLPHAPLALANAPCLSALELDVMCALKWSPYKGFDVDA